MLLKIAVCDDEAIHRLIIRDKLDKFAISNDVDYELDEFCTSEELLKIKNIYDIDKALNYMHELQAQMSQQMAAASFRVNNTAFDVILYEQEKACKEQDITFEKQILYNDLSILKYIDTCTIFANALDNAVKACSEIQNGEKKITLEVKRTNDILSIIIENTKQNEVIYDNKKIVSSKLDKHNHGFGVENIKMAVEKYNGIVSIDYTDTIFTLAISIPLLNEQK